MLILFWGDEITGGGPENGGACGSYPHLVEAELGFKYPQRCFRVLNRGRAGDRAANLLARWQEDAVAEEPDILSVLIGSNDAAAEYYAQKSGTRFDDRFEELYSTLLGYARASNPALRLILLEPFMLDSGNMSDDYPARYLLLEKRRETTAKLAKRYGAVFVPLQEYFDRSCARMQPGYWIGDSVHPTVSGQGLIADAWLEAAKDYLGITYPQN